MTTHLYRTEQDKHDYPVHIYIGQSRTNMTTHLYRTEQDKHDYTSI